MIRLEEVTFGYKPEETVINNLTWEFQTGLMTAVTGPAGKANPPSCI